MSLNIWDATSPACETKACNKKENRNGYPIGFRTDCTRIHSIKGSTRKGSRPIRLYLRPETLAVFRKIKHFKFKLVYMYRSHTCGELRISDVGKKVTLAGWVQTVRKFGAITFVDLRDRYGITQLLMGEDLNAVLDANPLGREFVLQAEGIVAERSNKNSHIATGEVEIAISSFKILNKSAVPPFTIQDDTDGGEDLRMKYRYLDLRRNAVKKKYGTPICREQISQKLFT